MVTLLDVSAVAGHHAMPAALLFAFHAQIIVLFSTKLNDTFLKMLFFFGNYVARWGWGKTLNVVYG